MSARGKYILMPDENVSATQLARVYCLRPGEWIDASQPMALRGRRGMPDVPLYPVYRPNDPRAERQIYEQFAHGIEAYRRQGRGELFNPYELEVPGHLLNGEPYRR